MAGTPPGTPPPEVPEEFAEAYRAAYERALAEQTTGARHVETDDHADADLVGGDVPESDRWAFRLPRRSGPPRDATHREPDPPETPVVRRPRDRRHLAPLLLLLLAVLLVLGAFVVGRLFTASVGG